MRRVLITGANRGYGLALVQETLARGDRVFATCRQAAAAPELMALAQSERCTVLEVDLLDEGQIEELVRRVSAETDALDLLLNNAGRMGGDDLASLDAEELSAKFAVNAIAPLMLSRACMPLLAAGDNPCIMMSSSSWGSITYKTDPTNNASDSVFGYCASKAALNMFSRTLAEALKPQGITVLMHHPGGKGDPGGGPVDARESARATLSLVEAHGPEDTGRFYHWRGYEIPW